MLVALTTEGGVGERDQSNSLGKNKISLGLR